MRKLFEGVFSDGKLIFTQNLVRGEKVYGERLVSEDGVEYRQWNANRSKLGAALKKGLLQMPLEKGSKVIYLGAAEGTTISHISDIVGEKGLVVGIDLSATSMRRFVMLCEKRQNILPLLADALKVDDYPEEIRKIKFDLLFQDVSQKNQSEIFMKNAQFLRPHGFGMLSVKARSIDVLKEPFEVFREESLKISKEFEVLQTVGLEPFEKDHALIFCRRK